MKLTELIQRNVISIVSINIIILIFLFLCYSPGFPAIKQGTFEFLTGQYNLNDSRFKAVYSENGAIYGLSLSANLFNPLNFYLEIKYFQKEGALTYTKEKNSIPPSPSFHRPESFHAN